MKRTKDDTTTAPAVQFIEPMYALAVQNIPEGEEWLYEVKFDGYRCLAGRDKNGVTLWSRRGNLFTSQFPLIARACGRLPVDTLLDGEIVAIDQNGRISFKSRLFVISVRFSRGLRESARFYSLPSW